LHCFAKKRKNILLTTDVLLVAAVKPVTTTPTRRILMEKQSRRGCVVMGGLVALLVLLLGAVWWFFRSGSEMTDAPPSGTMFVFLLSPASGDEVEVGDYVPVSLNAFGLNPLARAELFVNGISLGVVGDYPENAFWAWRPLSAGVYSLTARVTDMTGEVEQSQTVIVNVFPGDGLVQVTALEGQTLQEIGADFGVLPAQMVVSNPNFSPEQPLPDGASVQVPIGDEGAGNGSGQAGEEVSIPLIFWEFTPLTSVDKSYCYTSSGDGNWIKMPKKPFDFFSGSPLKYIQQDGIPKAGAGVIKVQCWGWLGETLKFLGEGETKFDIKQPTEQLVISGQGFELKGKPQIPPSPPDAGGKIGIIPSPFAVRKAADIAECANYKAWAGGIDPDWQKTCQNIFNASVLQYFVLVWEWEPKNCWPMDECLWINDIDGYRLYEVDPTTQTEIHLANVEGGRYQKAVAVPLPWGPSPCYRIRAYVKDPLIEDSGFGEYCPGDLPTAQKVILTPATHWLTTGGTYLDNDCDMPPSIYAPGVLRPEFGKNAGQVTVGSYLENYAECLSKGHYYAGVKFSLSFPLDAVISKAVLKFSHIANGPLSNATGVAAKKPTSCIANVGTAKQDWGGVGSNENHYLKNNFLAGPGYYAPVVSLSPYTTHNVDVTFIVKEWTNQPDKNHGFILAPISAPYPINGHGVCLSELANFELEIYYFVPPNN
jgi:hypothetical protein